jgi:pilus assembly protein CpaB
MSSRRILILLVAVALAGVAAFSTYNYVSSADERATQEAELLPIYRVDRTIPRGLTFGEARAGGYVREGRIPREDYPSGTAITDADFEGLNDQVALIDIPAGQLLVRGLFVDREQTQVSFSDRLDERDGMVAASFSLDQVHGVAGFIVPGDRINIMITGTTIGDPEADEGEGEGEELPGDAQDLAQEVEGGDESTWHVLQYVEVLAVDREVQLAMGETTEAEPDDAEEVTMNSGLLTVALSSEDAARLAHMVNIDAGRIYVTLLPPDYVPAPVTPIDAVNFLGAVLPTRDVEDDATDAAAQATDDPTSAEG